MLAVSAVTGAGIEALEPYLARGRTVAVVGSAGGRGRHTTTRRDLLPLPGGALLLDTPGMRELQMWASEEALDSTFPEVATLAEACRFADCAHEREPGCAVRAALDDGSLPGERHASWRKQQRELRALERRRDGRSRAEAKRISKQTARAQRRYYGR